MAAGAVKPGIEQVVGWIGRQLPPTAKDAIDVVELRTGPSIDRLFGGSILGTLRGR